MRPAWRDDVCWCCRCRVHSWFVVGNTVLDDSDTVSSAPSGTALIAWPAALASRGTRGGDHNTLECPSGTPFVCDVTACLLALALSSITKRGLVGCRCYPVWMDFSEVRGASMTLPQYYSPITSNINPMIRIDHDCTNSQTCNASNGQP